MDTNIVVVCLIHSLVEKNLQTARQLKVMLDVEFPGNQVIDIEEYLKYCSKCGSKGWSRQDCPRCEGNGKCPRCEGEGDSMNLKSWDVACSACKGVGECAACEGSGKVSGICRTCMGLGRVFERPRCEIRRELLIDDMNEFYRLRQAGSV